MDFLILGPLEVRDGQAPVAIGQGKQRAVLALLLLNAGRVVSSDRFVDELWGERPPATVGKALQVYVSKLRKALGPEAIATRAPGYVLDADPERLDHRRFERLVSEGRAAAGPGEAAELLAEALAMWRGPALADLAYEPFAQSEIVRLEELRLAALEERIEADLALGRHAMLVGELEAHIADQPLRERLRGQLILALYRSGRQADSLEAYRRARETLVEELGIEPGAALAELERAVLNHDPALDAPAGPPAPSPPPPAAPEPAAVPAAVEERKLVSVLFAEFEEDADADPERLSAALERVHAAAVEELEAAGAVVERGVGEALLATFGAPAAQEDHGERALHAALAIRAAIAVPARIGIDSGEVLVRAADGDALAVRGQPVVGAARLARAAQPGEIMVGERTAGAARGAFELGQAGDRLLLRRALGLPRERGGGAGRRALIGRETELGLLEAGWQRVARDGRPHVVTVIGEAGVGKTRLVAALRERLGATARWHVGRCLAYGRGITYRPLAQILRKRLGVLEGSHPAAIREQLTGRSILGLTLGLEPDGQLSPREARAALHEAWIDELAAMAGEGSTVLVVEDLHWAEPALLELLDQAARDVQGPLMLVVTARPELVERRPAWGRDASRIWLEPLSQREAADLVAGRAGDLAPRLVEQVLDRAGGNPFFLEELVQSLHDRGGALEAIPIADSVQAVIAARIDLLPANEKTALQAGAVIGRSFWAGALDVGGATLDPLLDRDFVRRVRESSLAGEAEYVFKHALTREVAYASLPVGRRAELHAAFADWLEEGGRAGDENASLLGHHLAEAASAGQDDELRARAVRWLRRAGELAFGRYEMAGAAALFEQAVPLATDDAERVELLRASARACSHRFEMDGYRSALERAVELAPDARSRADLYAELAHDGAQPYMWKHPPAAEDVERWIEGALAGSPALSQARAVALVARGYLDPRSGGEACRQGVELAERLELPEIVVFGCGGMADVATAAGRLEEAREWSDRSIANLVAVDDPDRISGRRFHAAFVYGRLGLLEEARGHADRHTEVTAGLSPHHDVHDVAVHLLVETLAGRWEAAAELAERAAAACAANEETPCQFNWRSLLMAALALAELGDGGGALRFERFAVDALEVAGPIEREPSLLRLALVRRDLDAVRDVLAADPGAGVWDVDYRAARLDGLAAVGDGDGVEREAPPALALGGYVEPFALRALGRVRGDSDLLGRADARFRELGLTARAGAVTHRR